MDQVTLIGPEDFSALKWHIKGNDQLNKLTDRTFYIYAEINSAQKEIAPFTDREDIVFIPESEVLEPGIFPNKWIYQQLLKLSVDKLRESHDLSKEFLFTDIDTMPVKEITKDLFYRDGKPFYYMSSNHDKPTLTETYTPPDKPIDLDPGFINWHYAMTRSTEDILRIKAPGPICAIDACTIWSLKILKRMKRHIEGNHDIPWQEAIIKCFIQFLMSHQTMFTRKTGFREIDFTPGTPVSGDSVCGLNELMNKIRLGFSEWQLYAHYNTFVESRSNRYLGLLGKAPGPHVSEFNTGSQPAELLERIIKDPNRAGFLYFYPNIKGVENILEKIY